MWRASVLGTTAVVFLLGAGDQREAPETFPIVFHVPNGEDGDPVLETEALDALISVASHHFGPAQIHFEALPQSALPAAHNKLETYRERRALRRFAVPGVINVFVVEEIADPHPSAATLRTAGWLGQRPTGFLSGAHVPAEGLRPDTYILLDRGASPLTLTHELGHFFGAAHSSDPDNLMSYGQNRRWFSDAQLEYFRRMATRRRRDVRRSGT